MKTSIQPVLPTDIPGLKNVIDSCGLFPSEYLDDMISDYFNNANTQDLWFAYMDNHSPVAFGYCVPEKFTNGTYNLLAIGVSKDSQRKGIATEMMHFIEQEPKRKQARILIVETSNDGAQMGARNFYKKIGYTQEAVIRDFWNSGEDKIVFWKEL